MAARPGALAQAQRAVQAGGEVAVAEAEPGLVAEARERLHQREAVAREAVAPLAVDATRERVGHDVEVGRDVDAVELAVVAGVHDRGHLLRRHRAHEPAQEARGADAARERDHAQRVSGGIAVRARRAARAARAGRELRQALRQALGDLAERWS